MASDWRSYKSSSPSNSAATSSSSPKNSSLHSNTNRFQSSKALSRSSGLYGKQFDAAASGRRSPVITGQRGKTRHNSEASDGRMHPAARTLNKRAASVERLFPLRSSHLPSKSESNGDTSSYNRSTSLDASARYGGSGSDLNRLSHSRVSSSTERLDEDMMTDKYNFSSSSSHDFSPNHSPAYHNGMSSASGRSYYSFDEVERIKSDYEKQLQNVKLEYQSRILAKDRDWDKKLQACKSELANSQKMVTELRQRCNQMAEEYDKSMTELLNDRERSVRGGAEGMTTSSVNSDTIKALKTERDQYAEDLQQVEKSFTELHKRYDKLRETTQNQRQTEEKLKAELSDSRRQLQDSAINFDKMRDESQLKLSRAATEVDKAKSSCKAEIVRLQMAFKKSELHAQSLEQQLKQKVSENSELSQICDNLIALKSGDSK